MPLLTLRAIFMLLMPDAAVLLTPSYADVELLITL